MCAVDEEILNFRVFPFLKHYRCMPHPCQIIEHANFLRKQAEQSDNENPDSCEELK